MKRPRQINLQVTEELLEDIKVLAERREQSQSELIRSLVNEALIREAESQVVFE